MCRKINIALSIKKNTKTTQHEYQYDNDNIILCSNTVNLLLVMPPRMYEELLPPMPQEDGGGGGGGPPLPPPVVTTQPTAGATAQVRVQFVCVLCVCV